MNSDKIWVIGSYTVNVNGSNLGLGIIIEYYYFPCFLNATFFCLKLFEKVITFRIPNGTSSDFYNVPICTYFESVGF